MFLCPPRRLSGANEPCLTSMSLKIKAWITMSLTSLLFFQSHLLATLLHPFTSPRCKMSSVYFNDIQLKTLNSLKSSYKKASLQRRKAIKQMAYESLKEASNSKLGKPEKISLKKASLVVFNIHALQMLRFMRQEISRWFNKLPGRKKTGRETGGDRPNIPPHARQRWSVDRVYEQLHRKDISDRISEWHDYPRGSKEFMAQWM